MDTITKPNYTGYTPLDGYAWMEWMSEKRDGLRLTARSEAGEWPYHCIMTGRKDNKVYILAEFCEHDVKVWELETLQEVQDLFNKLK